MVQMIPRSQKIDAMLPANISCMVDGGPYSDIVWYKDGSQLVFSNNTRYCETDMMWYDISIIWCDMNIIKNDRR